MHENINHQQFPGLVVAGDLPVEERRSRVRLMSGSESETQDSFVKAGKWTFGKPQAWEYTDHAFGFIAPILSDTDEPVLIQNAGTIKADSGLRGKQITVTLDRLRVYQYPGGGEHEVLFDFYAEQNVENSTQSVHFTQKYRARDGSGAGVTGFPVFRGLSVGNSGIAFKGFTVNVKNRESQNFLKFLEGDVFKTGLKLIGTLDPAIPVIASYATGIAENEAKKNDNLAVQDFFLGLDFSNVATRARLAIGSYVVIQVPLRGDFHWDDYVFIPRTGEIRTKENQAVPFNYLIFGISEDMPISRGT